MCSALVLIVMLWSGIARFMPAETAAPRAMSVATSEASERNSGVVRELEKAAQDRPGLHWLAGQLSLDATSRQRHWRQLIAHSPDRLELLRSAAPDAHQLSEQAIRRWPQHASAWRWHQTADPPDEALQLRVILGLSPEDGEAWLRLGDLHATLDPTAALHAWIRACEHGDPGANGCWRAGRLAEALGDPELARHLYRSSRWPNARKRAELLPVTEQNLLHRPHRPRPR